MARAASSLRSKPSPRARAAKPRAATGKPVAATDEAEHVGRRDLEATLAELRSRVSDPRAGLFGPSSMMWEIGRESACFLGGGRAALLQLAHPYVAHGVDQHSKTRTDPFGRFQRTFANVFDMIYGDLDSALESARRVHQIHARIHGPIREKVGRYAEGDRYRANEVPALMWVHATLWDSAVQAFELVVRKLTAAEKDRYYEETKLFALLFGIPLAALPPDWASFAAYNRRMWESEDVVVGDAAREIASFLLTPPDRLLTPVTAWAKIVTAGLLPPRIRAGFGLRFGVSERRVFDATIRALRATHRSWPYRVRYVPAYIEARRRLTGRTDRDRIGELLTRITVGRGRAAA
ncbi:MAG: oxygenase MpaB family protein [bacterium]